MKSGGESCFSESSTSIELLEEHARLGLMESATRARENRRWGTAWVLLTASLAVHVLDEAVNDFLSFYNPYVLSIRASFPWLPFPVFRFSTWLGLLIFAVVALLLLSVLVFRGKWGMKPVAYIYGWLMVANALLHFSGSLWYGRLLAGVWSSPLLLACSLYMLKSIPRKRS